MESGAFNTVMSVGFDDAGRVLVAYVKYDAAGLTQLYLARHDAAGRWEIVQASTQALGSAPRDRRIWARAHPRALLHSLTNAQAHCVTGCLFTQSEPDSFVHYTHTHELMPRRPTGRSAT